MSDIAMSYVKYLDGTGNCHIICYYFIRCLNTFRFVIR